MHLLERADLHHQPPNMEKYKASKFYHLLKKVADILDEGTVSQGLQSMPYNTLEGAAKENPVIDEICEALGVTSYQSLWRLLVQAFPDFKKSKIYMIAFREPVQAQQAAEQLLGQRPVCYEYVTKDSVLQHHPLLQRFMQPGFQFFYKWTQLWLNVFLDAGKIEPERWAKQRTAIIRKGTTSKIKRVTHTLAKQGVGFLSDGPCSFLYGCPMPALAAAVLQGIVASAGGGAASVAVLHIWVCNSWIHGCHCSNRQQGKQGARADGESWASAGASHMGSTLAR